MMRAKAIAVAAFLLLGCGCDRSGFSKQFREPADEATQRMRQADASGSAFDVEQADHALAEAKAASQTPRDVQFADFLDWYSILLHRRDRERTRMWRQLCAREARLYFDGQASGYARVSGEDVRVVRGSCQNAALQMMREDCLRSGGPLSACVASGNR